MEIIKQTSIDFAASVNDDAAKSAQHIKDIETLTNLQTKIYSNPYSKKTIEEFNKEYSKLFERLTAYKIIDPNAILQLENLKNVIDNLKYEEVEISPAYTWDKQYLENGIETNYTDSVNYYEWKNDRLNLIGKIKKALLIPTGEISSVARMEFNGDYMTDNRTYYKNKNKIDDNDNIVIDNTYSNKKNTNSNNNLTDINGIEVKVGGRRKPRTMRKKMSGKRRRKVSNKKRRVKK